MSLRPVGRNLIVKFKKPEVEDKTIGGLILPKNKNAPDEPVDAIVLAVADECEYGVCVNDVVLISPYCGITVRGGTEEEPHRLIVEKDIIAIVES